MRAHVPVRARVTHQGEEPLPGGETRGGPVEILVRGALSADQATEPRQDRVRVEPVQRAEPGAPRLAELENDHAPSLSRDARHLRESGRGILDVPDAEGDRRDVEG